LDLFLRFSSPAGGLHGDVQPGDRFFWFTTTGWVVWNFLIGNLMLGATIVLYDGSPAYPDLDVLWKLAAEAGVTTFGVSPNRLGTTSAGSAAWSALAPPCRRRDSNGSTTM
jgi:acyl-coenzyme A synthetase/AMP-(fatty) acid ligase